jgi:glutamine synthetase
MASYKFEYLWLDGYKPTANLRSKTKIIQIDKFNGELELLPEWNFDGSSTQQAEGSYSEVVLKPVRVYPDPYRKDGYFVVAECLNPDGTPHATNTRTGIKEANLDDFWFGFEQEYVLLNDAGRPIGFPTGGYPEPQGPYYCSVGYQYNAGREIAEKHLEVCLEAGLGITGVNAEVMLGQWEFQCFGKGLKAADDLMVARYILFRITEMHQVQLELHPKPIQGDWNGSGMHTNFSWTYLREVGGKEYLEEILEGFKKHHDEHLTEYGAYNEMRLTGRHETASYEEFSYGVGNRGASIRIPVFTVQDDYKGYLEDRRPSSNADPYTVVKRIIATVNEAHQKAVGK